MRCHCTLAQKSGKKESNPTNRTEKTVCEDIEPWNFPTFLVRMQNGTTILENY
jgi:hypothetical protein